MATYYVDNVGGNDSNSGLSEALAFASFTKLKSVAALTGADIIRVKYTGTDYVVTNPAATGAAFSTDGGTTVVNGLMVTGYTSNTQNPTIEYQNTGNTFYTTWNARKNIGINLKLNYQSSPGTYHLTPTANVVSFKSSTITYVTSSGTAINNGFSGLVELANCTINFQGYLTLFSGTAIAKKIINSRIININPSGVSTTVGVFSTASGQTYNKSIFHFKTAGTTNHGIFYVASASTNSGYMTNCTILIDNASTGTANIALCQLQNTHVSNINAFNETMISNVFIDMRTTKASCVLRTSASVTAGDAYKLGVNNNAYFTSAKFVSFTDSATGAEAFSNFALSGNPFLSVDPTNADFCKPDTSDADGLLLSSSNALDTNTAVGAIDAVGGAGATPNAYDLRAGVVVGGVTGTLVIPAVSDVRSGVNYDVSPNAKTGTCVIPTAANTKIGVSVDVSDTGTYDGSDRFSDPGISNVLSGVTYTYNTVLKTGTAAAYPLLAANVVKIGTDRGDGVTGTYDGSERYTDLDLSQVKTGYNFRYNSLTNNRSGTFDYSALFTDPGQDNVTQYVQYKFNSATYNKTGTLVVPSALDTKIGVALGPNGILTGEYDGSDRYSDPGEANVLKDTAYRYNSLTNNKLGTLESTDPGVSNVVSGITYKINSVSKTGTRSAIYPLLAVNVVKIDTDRGDGQLGTYVASERYTDLDLSNVKESYSFRYNSLTNNRTGTHAEKVSTDPGVANVRSGTTYKIDDVNKTGTLDLPSEADVKFNVSFDNGSKTGTDIGADFNDELLEDKVQLGLSYKNLNVDRIGSLTGGSPDYPAESVVLFPTSYAFGTKTGTLGAYNNTNLDIISQMQSNAKSIIASVLTTDFSELRYLKEVEKNDFYNNTKQYGIRALDNEQTKELIGKDTIEQTYEIVLTTDFQNRDGDDFEREAELFLMSKFEEIRRQLRISKFGFSQQVRIVKDINAAECQKVGDNVIVLKGKVKVGYSVN